MATMGGNQDSEEFQDEDALDEGAGDDELDLDRAMREIDTAKKRAARGGEPAWRRLEQRAEQKLTAEQISDFEDYEIDEPGKPAGKPTVRR